MGSEDAARGAIALLWGRRARLPHDECRVALDAGRPLGNTAAQDALVEQVQVVVLPRIRPHRGPEPDPERQRLRITHQEDPDRGVLVRHRNGRSDRSGRDGPEGDLDFSANVSVAAWWRG